MKGACCQNLAALQGRGGYCEVTVPAIQSLALPVHYLRIPLPNFLRGGQPSEQIETGR